VCPEEDAEFHYWRASELRIAERFELALGHLLRALEIEPTHLEAMVASGDVYLFGSDELGLSDAQSEELALECFDRAIEREPDLAGAWSGRALVLLYRDDFCGAIEAADRGLRVLHRRVGYGMTSDPVYSNVAEALIDVKVRSLFEQGKLADARAELSAALTRWPRSRLLNCHTSTLLNDCLGGTDHSPAE
jgi:tetratricopeptide (TPR) repeat protein